MPSRLPEIVVEEKIVFNPKTIRFVNRNTTLYPEDYNKKGVITIVRNLSDDTFNIEYEKMGMRYHSVVPFLNLAAKGKTMKPFDLRPLAKNATGTKPFRIHRSIVDNTKLHDISGFTVGYSFGYDEIDSHYVRNSFSRISTAPAFPEVLEYVGGSFRNVIHFKTIKTIEISKHTPYKVTNAQRGSSVIMDEDVVDTKLTYNNIYLVPIMPERLKTNKTLFNIYMNNDGDRNIEHDHILEAKGMTSTSFGAKKISTQVVANVKGDDFIPADGHPATLIGRVNITGRSFYDFEKKKTTFGNNQNAEPGEIIPYNLEGNYVRTATMSLNSTFSNIKISLARGFDRSILDSNSGSVRLRIKSSENPHNIQLRHLNSENIETIKTSDLTLRALTYLHD